MGRRLHPEPVPRLPSRRPMAVSPSTLDSECRGVSPGHAHAWRQFGGISGRLACGPRYGDLPNARWAFLVADGGIGLRSAPQSGSRIRHIRRMRISSTLRRENAAYSGLESQTGKTSSFPLTETGSQRSVRVLLFRFLSGISSFATGGLESHARSPIRTTASPALQASTPASHSDLPQRRLFAMDSLSGRSITFTRIAWASESSDTISRLPIQRRCGRFPMLAWRTCDYLPPAAMSLPGST